MDLRKNNSVFNLLIEEIKNKEKEEINNLKSTKIKGKDFARSLLKSDCVYNYYNIKSKKKENDTYFGRDLVKYKDEEEDVQTNGTNEKKIIIDKEENLYNRKEENETENEKREDSNENEYFDEENDSLSETEKQVLQFYDPTIDDYDEEYVTRKYRFMDKSCNSSLCCCGCFNPVCYKSERHSNYINQYKSLYAVSVVLEKEKILNSKEIRMKKVTSHGEVNSEDDTSVEQSTEEEKEEKEEKEEEKEKEKEEKEEKEKVQQNDEKQQMEPERGEKKTNITKKNSIDKFFNHLEEKTNTVQTQQKKGKRKNFTYYPVFCANCDNHLAYYEIETKLFYFFDVLPD